MGFDLNSLATKKANITVDFMGQSAVITYNPSILTSANIEKGIVGGDSGFVDVFTDLVLDWDVKRGNRKVPITENGLKGVPLPFLKSVLRAIIQSDATEGDREEGKASNAG